jgi:GAF domain-containing protein
MPVNEDLLGKALDRIATFRQDPPEVAAVLAEVVDAACTIFSVTGVGLMLVDPEQVLRYVVASNEAVRALEVAQEQTGHGPCIDSLVHGRLVTSPDLHVDDRWPEVSARLRPSRVRAVLGVPVVIAGNSVGSLNAYVEQAHAWDEAEVRALASLAEVTSQVVRACLAAKRSGALAEQLQYALDHRIVIERAVGVVMATQHLGAVDAFEDLRRRARSRRVRVAEIAAALLADHEHAVETAGG